MAERRMFAKSVVLSDAFLNLPIRSRCLYFTLCMVADDDGFINSTRSVLRQCGATAGDLKRLVEKDFLLEFNSGVVVIRHWRVHNLVKSDRYRKTAHQEEKAQLILDENKVYVLCPEPKWNPSGNHLETQDRLGKDRIGQDRLDQDRLGQDRKNKNNLNLSHQNQDSSDSDLTQSEKIAHWRAQLQRLEG